MAACPHVSAENAIIVQRVKYLSSRQPEADLDPPADNTDTDSSATERLASFPPALRNWRKRNRAQSVSDEKPYESIVPVVWAKYSWVRDQTMYQVFLPYLPSFV